MTSRNAQLNDVFGAYAVVTGLTIALTQLRRLPVLADYIGLLVGILFLGVAYHMVARRNGDLSHYGMDLAGLLTPPSTPVARDFFGVVDLLSALRKAAPSALREMGVALGVTLVLFPPFAGLFAMWHGPSHGFELTWPPETGYFLLGQLVMVALPEEALFRGFFYTRLRDHLAHGPRIGGRLTYLRAQLAQATLFALLHFVVDWQPARLAVFFPALLFGALRQWRGGLGAAVVCHALSNLYAEVLVRSWL